MTWYKKDTRPNLLLAHSVSEGHEFANLLKNALASPDYTVDLIPTSRANNFKLADSQSIVCVDLEAALAFSGLRGNVCLFAQSPYDLIEASTESIEKKKELFLALHNSLSKAKRVIALSDTCRGKIQQYHSQHIYLSHLPSTHSEAISALPLDGVAVIVSDLELRICDELLQNLQQFDPAVYLTPTSARRKVDTLAMRLPFAGLVPVRPKVQIYLGADNSECTPLRIIDAAAAGSAIVQISHKGMNWERGRRMPTNCIGYFNLEQMDTDKSELDAFIAHMLSNQMFFDSILAAQRRHLTNYQSNKNHIFELLSK